MKKSAKQKSGRGKKVVTVDIRYREWRFTIAVPKRFVTKMVWPIVLGLTAYLMLRYPELGQIFRHLWQI